MTVIRLRILLFALLALQVGANLARPDKRVDMVALGTPPSIPLVNLASLRERQASYGLLALRLQSFDNQAGTSLPFAKLDYPRLVDWLSLLLELHPPGTYPLLLASQVYSQSPDHGQQRLMLDFVYAHFLEEPDLRWPWLAHAAVMAKHHLHDLPLALKYARAVSELARAAPGWARQMPVFILEDMGEAESARVLLGALLAEKTAVDPHERHFLIERLQSLEMKNAEKSSGSARLQQTLPRR